MPIQVIVFDFDGTLVDSNPVKYNAYFELFPKDPEHGYVIRRVLSECFEESRYMILAKILRAFGEEQCELDDRISRLADHYNNLVVSGVKTCPECLAAENVLQQLSLRYPLYLSSTTPEEPLREIVSFRRWAQYFKAVFGYPRRKPDTLRMIMESENVQPGQVLVVGDGESDRLAAQEIGGCFFNVNHQPLSTLVRFLETFHQRAVSISEENTL